MSETYDNHTLYVHNRNLFEEREIAEILVKAIKNYERENDDKIDTFFRINIVRNQDKEPMGYAWLWVSNPKLYHLLSGNNPDGTERIELIEKEGFIKPKKTIEERIKEIMETEGKKQNPWLLDAFEDEVRNSLKSEYSPSLIEKKLPSLMDLEGIHISRGKITYPDDNYNFNELKNSYLTPIPPWVTKEMIYEIFRPYVTDKSSNYPKIKINNNSLLVEFDRNSFDSLVAFNMTRKLFIGNGEDEYLIIFNFSKIRRND